jgi:hypothetical protein
MVFGTARRAEEATMSRMTLLLMAGLLIAVAAGAGAQPFVYGRPYVLPNAGFVYAPTYVCPAPYPYPGGVPYGPGFGAADPSAARPGITWFQPGQLIPPSVGLAPGARAPLIVPPGLDGSVPSYATVRPGRRIGSGTARGTVPPGVRRYLDQH